MVVVAEGDETERLQRSIAGGADRAEHLSDASHRATLDLEGYFDKIALTQRSAQPQQASGNGNSLKFSFGALTVLQHDECGNGTTKLNTWRAFLRMHLGEVSHASNTIPCQSQPADYGRRVYGNPAERPPGDS